MVLHQYMNSGAGCIAGFFVHEKHFSSIASMPRLEGWWCHKMSTRFQMTNGKQSISIAKQNKFSYLQLAGTCRPKSGYIVHLAQMYGHVCFIKLGSTREKLTSACISSQH